MITRLEKVPEFKISPGFTEIKSIFEAYEGKYDFCTLYGQKIKGKLKAVMLRFYGRVLAETQGRPDLDELEGFIALNCFDNIHTHSLRLASRLAKSMKGKSGNSFVKAVKAKVKDQELKIDLEESFSIIKKEFSIPDSNNIFEEWYADVSHRIRRGKCAVFCYGGKGTVTVNGIDDNFAFICHTAVVKKGEGTGSRMLSALEAEVSSRFIAADSQNAMSDNFYIKNGFKNNGKWFEFTRKDK